MATHGTTEVQPSNAAAVTTAAKHAQGKKAIQRYMYTMLILWLTQITPPRSSGFLCTVKLYLS